VKERAKKRQGGGEITLPDIRNPDGYQKKRVRGEAKRIVDKTKRIVNLAQIGTEGSPGPSQTSLGVNKSGVEQFEWSLITLVSVAWNLLRSQYIFYEYVSK
jgi:hypothetical protein